MSVRENWSHPLSGIGPMVILGVEFYVHIEEVVTRTESSIIESAVEVVKVSEIRKEVSSPN
tara:strand:- start:116 stop:298 length:183 start_codon:yes stop_codon:yes gene_type:complete